VGKQFPRTEVAGVSLPRIIIGSNWLMGYSHRSSVHDQMIRERYAKPEDFFPVFEAYQEYGINAVMGIVGNDPLFSGAIDYAAQKTGKEMIIIDTPIINVTDSPEARREAEAGIKKCAAAGAKFCLPHHSSVEQLMNKNKRQIERLDDYTKMIRDAGMIPGLSAHMPENIIFTDENGYDVETYIQIYNCLGFLMQVEIEFASDIINSAKKPVMTIKSMAAGRVTPFVGLNFSWNTIRPRDMITLGCFSADEVHQDVEISFAALEHRHPNLEKRGSPNKEQAAFGK